MANNISLIVGREFRARVRKKSFIITTLLMPVLMIGLMVAPALIMEYSQGEQKRIAVIDESGLVAPQLQSDEAMAFETIDLAVEEARNSLADHFAILYIGSDILSNPSNVRLYANASTSIMLEEQITSQIEQVIENEKLKAYQIDNLDQILAEVETHVSMQTFRNDKTEEEAQSGQSSIVATALGYILGFVLYMFLLIYGAMVMQSVIEEKNSRVLEVMVSSVKPFQLMMGKILGVASVAIVQVAIWGVLIFGVGSFVLPQLMPAEAMMGAEAMEAGVATNVDPEMLQVVSAMTDSAYLAKIFICLILFVFGGFLLYSAMFAAIGSAVDSVQDAQQLQTPVMLPIILGLLMMLAVINDPNSPIAFWFSVIPFTSPIVMMARIPYDIPMWEIVLSLVLLYASFMVMVWLAAKIYRVGIFMYGKKPSLKELWKWMRYKY
ncbi:MAG: ABC transporter permease [Alistipes sp.]|nr:ABC transporter permease [Alistipes sp.]